MGKQLTILEYPDPRLQRVALPIVQMTDSLRILADDMLATMYGTKSIGLAATQVDAHVRLVVVDISPEQHAPLVLANPEIVSRELAGMSEEQCLSVPGYSAAVARSLRIAVRALDREGRTLELDAEGLLAVCIQHEIDHLDGRLFIDRLPWLKRARARRMLGRRRRDSGSLPVVGLR